MLRLLEICAIGSRRLGMVSLGYPLTTLKQDWGPNWGGYCLVCYEK